MRSGVGDAQDNMDEDARLLSEMAGAVDPIIHLYRWKGHSATYGIFVDPFSLLNRQAVELYGLSLGKRPTGGGVTFHQWDLAFSVLVPASHGAYSINTLDNYAFVNQAVVRTVRQFKAKFPRLLQEESLDVSSVIKQFCMAKPTRYDVIDQGRKIGGAAQRRTRYGFLHQGSIFLVPPDMDQLAALLSEFPEVCDAMKQNSHYLQSDFIEGAQLDTLRDEVEAVLVEELQKSFRIVETSSEKNPFCVTN